MGIVALAAMAGMACFLVGFLVAGARKRGRKPHALGFMASLIVLLVCVALYPASPNPPSWAVDAQPIASPEPTEQPWRPMSASGATFIFVPPDWAMAPFAVDGLKMAHKQGVDDVSITAAYMPGEGARVDETDEALVKLQVDASFGYDQTEVERFEELTMNGHRAIRAVLVTKDEDAPELAYLIDYTLVREGDNAQLFLCKCPIALRDEYEPILKRAAESIAGGASMDGEAI